jgi:hypothetical protein
LIKESKIGGLIFFQGGPVRQANLTNRYQSKSKLPLFIGIDAEWGLSMRLDSTYKYPWNMTLGAIRDTKFIEKVGSKMGLESKRLGIHFNFAPVLDINTNPKNPIIGFRSFGENKENVTQSALALMKGFQSQGVFSTGKHFPGHGDTEADSHLSLPNVSFSKERIIERGLYRYVLKPVLKACSKRPQSLRKKSGKRPGGQAGHPGKTRQQEPPDEVVECQPADQCSGCGACLDIAKSSCVDARQEVDIPPIKSHITEYQKNGDYLSLWSASCGTVSRTRDRLCAAWQTTQVDVFSNQT